VAGTWTIDPQDTAAAAKLARELELDANDPAALACSGEFLLEGLYVNNRLSKYNARGKTFFKR
jgi:magnesium chelatase subunit I